jgi:hypothetical protein
LLLIFTFVSADFVIADHSQVEQFEVDAPLHLCSR